MNNGINLNFDENNRNLEYPKIEDLESMESTDIIEYINGLPAPRSLEQLMIFNEIWNQYSLRGGK